MLVLYEMDSMLAYEIPATFVAKIPLSRKITRRSVAAPTPLWSDPCRANTEYDVEASLDGGFASGVAEKSFTTSPVKPQPPTGVKIDGAGDKELTVSWVAPTDNGGSDITGYKVQWKSGAQGFTSARQEDAGATATSQKISSLTNGTTYTVRVLATNAVGDSVASNTDTGTPSTTPGAPDIEPSPGDEMLTVRLSAPDTGGSPITLYTVQWKSGAENYNTTRQATVTPPDTSYVIESLTNGTTYTVRAKARNTNGDSGWSAEETGTPIAKPPPTVAISLAPNVFEPVNVPFEFVITFSEEVEGFHCYQEAPATPVDGPLCEIGASYVGGASVDVLDLEDTGLNSDGEHVFTARVEEIFTGNLLISVGPDSAQEKEFGLGNTFGASIVETQRLDRAARSPRTEVWQSEMTPADIGGYLGDGTVDGHSGGSLDDDSFTWQGTDYTVEGVLYNSSQGQLELELDQDLPDQGYRMVLQLTYLDGNSRGNSHWPSLEDPRQLTSAGGGLAYHWQPVETDISAGERVIVTLQRQGPGGPPPQPTGLSAAATPGSAAITLSWASPPSGVTVTGYRVERRNRSGGEYTALVENTGTSTRSYTDTTAVAGTQYNYRVTARNSAGDSRPSYPILAGPPSQPQGATARGNEGFSTLSWNDPEDDTITGYLIERKDLEQGVGFTTLVANTGNTDTGYTDRSVEPGGRYAYRVKALNDFGESDPSDAVDVEIPGGDEDAGETVVWESTLTVKRWGSSSHRLFGFDDLLEKGKLDPVSLSQDGVENQVHFLFYEKIDNRRQKTKNLYFQTVNDLAAGSYILHLGDEAFAFDASGTENTFSFPDVSLSWRNGNKLEVTLVMVD